jgi:serine/threonine-protein kinase
MGVVYRARQVALDRVVALKMILAGSHADERERARFRTEAEAVARLQHPNIVQIYEIGESEGRPFFSLEYVDGGSLAAKLDGTPLPGKSAAQLVETLARAVHAAHQRGIVHRDLKPANVLLTADGTPKITDFGLAKRLDVERGQTQTGSIVGTPSYMAPEQAASKKDIGPAADVYALGAILYELLTGRPPFRAETPLDTVLQVLSAEPAPPSLLQPRVARDLETVCLKCLAKEPRQRYADAEALAADLLRFLDGRPILARPVGPVERLGRWARRNPAVASLAAASAFLFLAGFAGVTWQWYQAESQRIETGRQRDEAEQERARAKASFEQAQQAVDQYFTTVSESKLLTVPGLQPLRKELLEGALKYYQGFLDQRRDDPTVQMELAKAYFRVGSITGDLGSKADALRSYQQGVTLLEAWATAHSDDREVQRLLATSLINIGKVHMEAEQLAAALPPMQQALAIQQRLIRDLPGDSNLEDELALSLGNLGLLQNQLGNLTEASRCVQEALAIRRRHVQKLPNNPKARHALAGVLDSLGGIQTRQRQYRAAAATVRQAIDQERVAVEKAPQVLVYREWLGKHYFNLAVVQEMHLKQPAEAFATRQKARDLWEQLARENPSVIAYQHQLARACVDLGNLLPATGRSEDPLPYYDQARVLLEKAVHIDPGMAAYHSSLGAAWDAIAGQRKRQGKYQEALAALGEAIAHQRTACRLASHVHQSRRFLAGHYHNLGGLQEALARPTEALRAYEQARTIQEQLARDEPAETEYRSQLTSLWLDIGRCHSLARDHAAALRAYQQALPVSEELVRTDPANSQFLRQQGEVYLNLALVQFEMGKRDEAWRAYRQGTTRFEKLVADHPEEDPFPATLAQSYQAVAGHRAHAGQYVEAVQVWERARAFWEEQARRHPSVSGFTREWAHTCLQLGETYAAQRQLTQALRQFVQAREILVKLDRQAPGVEETQHLLARSHKSIGDGCYLLEKQPEALAAWQQARDVLEKLVRAHPDNPSDQSNLGGTLHNLGHLLAGLGQREEAMATLQQAINHQRLAFAKAPEASRQWLSNHYQVLAAVARDLGRPAPAVAASQARAKLWSRNASELYNTACEVALCVPLVGKGKPDLTAAEQTQRRQYIEQALILLRQAVGQGYHDVHHLKKDPDLASLHSQQGFWQLVAELEKARPASR